MMNPIFASSARKRMRTIRTPLILVLYNALLITFALFNSVFSVGDPTIYLNSMLFGSEAYITMIAAQMILIVLLSPAMTSVSISGERERQTMDLLLVTNTSSLQITMGKIMESFSFLALLIVSSFPLMCVFTLYGVITIGEVAVMLLFLLILALAALSIGIFCSSLFKRTITSTIASYIMILLLGVGTLAPLLFVNGKQLQKILLSADGLSAYSFIDSVGLLPFTVWMNPLVGVLSLLTHQTGLLERTFMQSLPSGEILHTIVEHVQFDLIAYLNMALLVLCSIAATLLASLFIRPRVKRLKQRAARRQKP